MARVRIAKGLALQTLEDEEPHVLCEADVLTIVTNRRPLPMIIEQL